MCEVRSAQLDLDLTSFSGMIEAASDKMSVFEKDLLPQFLCWQFGTSSNLLDNSIETIKQLR